MKYRGITGNYDLMKRINLENVLKTIITYQPISRAQIAFKTGLNKVTVSTCVDYFLQKGVLDETSTTSSTRGRPPTLITIRGRAGIIIGIEADIHLSRILVIDLAGKKLENLTFRLTDSDPMHFLDSIGKYLQTFQSKYNIYPLGVIGVGLALPGHYNYQSGQIEYVANLQTWNMFPIRDEIKSRFPNIPFFIETLANAGAMGEIHYGRASESEHLVYINGGWGLGVGIYLNGRIFRGYSGFAGRIGHSTIHMNGRKCSCGNRGCLEAYASIKALYQDLYSSEPFSLERIMELVQRYEHQEPDLTAAIHELTNHLALGLVNIINAYNPSKICIGGLLGTFEAGMINQLSQKLSEMLPRHFLRNLEIYTSKLGELDVAYGAASIVIDNFPQIFID